jgi:hypothetical protein
MSDRKMNGAQDNNAQSTVPAPDLIPAATSVCSGAESLHKKRNILEAVMMMLPPLVTLPLDVLTCFIAADAYLTARKQLITL